MDASSRILITAGPTHEPIDAVRYIANRSSGRLGMALAEEAAERGHAVTLLLGPTHLEPQPLSQLTVVRFRTTADLQELLREQWPEHDMLIMAAAVADYRPAEHDTRRNPPLPLEEGRVSIGDTSRQGEGVSGRKIARTDQPLTLHLEPTPDLLAELAAVKRADQSVIGFALEPPDPPERLLDSARNKLKRKGLDAIIANPLETMESETISGAVVILKDGREIVATPTMPKREFAKWLLNSL